MRTPLMSRLSPMPDMDSFFQSNTLPSDMANFMTHRPSMQSRQSPMPELGRGQNLQARQSPSEFHRANIQVRQSPPPERPLSSVPPTEHQRENIEKIQHDVEPRSATLPRSQSAKAEKFREMKKTSIEDFNEQIVNMLDDVEKRVESFREAAAQLELEKEKILDMLSNVNVNTELLRLGEGEREDICATTQRLLIRTKTVDVQVNTPRNQEQAKALQSVHQLIDGVLSKLQEDLSNGKETARRYLNACSPDEQGAIDLKFQAQVIECTADDQKKIRRKLAQIISQIERAERMCVPDYCAST